MKSTQRGSYERRFVSQQESKSESNGRRIVESDGKFLRERSSRMWLLRGFWDEWKFLSWKVVVDFLATRLVTNDSFTMGLKLERDEKEGLWWKFSEGSW